MIITCPRCFSTYRVPEGAVSGAGRRMRCSSCRFEWVETPPPLEAIAEFSPAPPQPVPSAAASAVEPDSYLRRSRATSAPATSARSPALRKASPSALWPALQWLGLAWLSVIVLGGVFRGPIGALSPVLADFYEDIGLPVETPYQRFRLEVGAPERREENGRTVIGLSGQLTNISRRMRDVPPLRMFWLGHDGNEGPALVLTVKPERLGVGEIGTFRGELVGVDARAGGEIKVTFDTPDSVVGSSSSHPPASAPAAPAQGHSP